jgi:predicted dehydrogenase
MSASTNRREFLKTGAALGVGFWIASREAAAQTAPTTGPSQQLNFACVGVAGKGDGDSNHVAALGNIAAICDVNDKNLDKKAQAYPSARKFNDFREMFDQMGDKIDAVTVSIPDHCHALVAMMAIKAGKHVYCQKPMTHTLAEARTLQVAARQYNVVTQMGNQGTAGDEFRRGVEILRAQMLGPVKEVHVWTNRPIWPQSPDIMARPTDTPPVPADLHWDLFLGPAPERPYNPAYQPFNWRGWWDFGTGALGDMGCHTVNLPFMGLRLEHPTSVLGKAGDLNPETYPSWAKVEFQFPARGEMPPVKLVWWEGHKDRAKTKRNIPGHDITRGFDLPESGSLMIGENGMMMSISDYGDGQRLIFNSDSAGFTGPPSETLPRLHQGDVDQAQKNEWVAAIQGHGTPMSHFDYAGLLTETILLGNVAIRESQTKLEWDAANMKFPNHPDAEKWLTYDYRKGYSL